MAHQNDLTNIPAAACTRCGGWTGFGGMSQHRDAATPVLGRTGCPGGANCAPMTPTQQRELETWLTERGQSWGKAES